MQLKLVQKLQRLKLPRIWTRPRMVPLKTFKLFSVKEMMIAKMNIDNKIDIVFAERIGAVERSPAGDATPAGERRARRIVVRLARRDLRDELLNAARVRRTLNSADLGAPGAPRRVYVNERLTRVNRVLFHQAREECRRLQWRYSWTKRGRIYVRQGEGKPVFSIKTAADITRVFNVANVSETV